MKLVENDSGINYKQLAVLCADIYNYSKLTEENEDFTHQNLKKRLQIVKRIIEMNSGKPNRLLGDSALATFECVSDAIYAAAEIQAASHKHNFELNFNDQLMYRIGISYGDVIFDMNEPYGNIVNIASRLESLAEPGSVYITDDALSKLDSVLPFRMVYRGNLKVKNIKKPINISKILLNMPISYNPPREEIWIKRYLLDGRALMIISLIILLLSLLLFVFSLGILVSVESIL